MNARRSATSRHARARGGWGLLFLPRESVSVQPVGDLLWERIVRYGTVPQTNESVFSLDTGGGAQHITQR